VEIEGFNVATRLDEELLKEIADLSSGTYFRAEDATSLKEIYGAIDLQLTINGEDTEVTAIFAGVGLLFFLIAGALSMVWFGRVP
jgi:Ca-activated chloride channel homolog